MHNYQGRLVILLALLAIANAAAWAVSLGRARQSAAEIHLSAVPRELGDWQGTDVPQSKDVLRTLAADALLQRTYVRKGVETDFWLVFARDWRDLHAPEACYLSGYWRIVGVRDAEIPPPEGMSEPLQGRVFVARKGGNTVLGLYLFATRQGTTANRARLGWALLRPGSGTYGLLIHAATAVEDGESLAAAEVTDFMRAVYPKVAQLLQATEAGAQR